MFGCRSDLPSHLAVDSFWNGYVYIDVVPILKVGSIVALGVILIIALIALVAIIACARVIVASFNDNKLIGWGSVWARWGQFWNRHAVVYWAWWRKWGIVREDEEGRKREASPFISLAHSMRYPTHVAWDELALREKGKGGDEKVLELGDDGEELGLLVWLSPEQAVVLQD
ncbi:hypothetical protein PG987_001854 [Apiospora arundinis]